MLYLVATPIGNLEDITYRAVELLRSVDLILCEDTRYSKRLLTRYEISKPCQSLHKFNESSQIASIIESLKAGKNIALISDAGTPGIADPGEPLVAACARESIDIIPIPGACAAIAAISCSGLATAPFQFQGFLPRKDGELRRALLSILSYIGTTVCYESPNRIVSVLKLLREVAPERSIVVARELTKIHETFYRGTAAEVHAEFEGKTPKGEIVLLISGNVEPEHVQSDLSPEEQVAEIESLYKVSKKEAIKIVAERLGLNKRELYSKMVKDRD